MWHIWKQRRPFSIFILVLQLPGSALQCWTWKKNCFFPYSRREWYLVEVWIKVIISYCSVYLPLIMKQLIKKHGPFHHGTRTALAQTHAMAISARARSERRDNWAREEEQERAE